MTASFGVLISTFYAFTEAYRHPGHPLQFPLQPFLFFLPLRIMLIMQRINNRAIAEPIIISRGDMIKPP